MIRYKITIEYIGTNFVGWQRQHNGLSVQQTIEDAIYNFVQETVTVHGAGRTDAGVHAVGQVAHFDITKNYHPQEIIGALNCFLRPLEVGITACEIVDDQFHARFSAIRRHYYYRIINRPCPLILERGRAWWVMRNLSITSMQEASQRLVGTHDFTSFRAMACQAASPIRTINYINVFQEGQVITITISAKSFLHHMVRNIVGTLVAVGRGKLDADRVQYILDQKLRRLAGATAPACGLYFQKVDYKS